MRRIAIASMVLGMVGGCTTTETDVRPFIQLTLDTPGIAYAPGVQLDIPVAWTATCTTEGLPDTSHAQPCDEQHFTVRVTCDGAPCDLDPPEASTGLELFGTGTVHLQARTPGDMTITVSLERLDTHEPFVRSGKLVVRDLERVVIDCIYEAYDPAVPRCWDHGDGSIECREAWVPCPSTATVDPTWGTPISIWVYGEGGGLPISPQAVIPSLDEPLRPHVTFGAFAPKETDFAEPGHANTVAGAVALKYGAEPRTAVDLAIHGTLDPLAADLAMHLATP